jgi:hypothetical protein
MGQALLSRYWSTILEQKKNQRIYDNIQHY